MLKPILLSQYQRDLKRLYQEIDAFKEESNLWSLSGNIKNSSGNLALHLVGNLNHFIGHIIGNSGYVRDREFEFEGNNVPKSTLLKAIDKTYPVIENALQGLTSEALNAEFPIQIFKDQKLSTAGMLIHLSNHLNYHLGQINYLRRAIES